MEWKRLKQTGYNGFGYSLDFTIVNNETYHYDKEGTILDIPANTRTVGIPFPDFLKTPIRIGIACGKEKAEAIHAALKGGFLTILVTDEAAALRILNNS